VGAELLLSANWRFIGATTLDNNSNNPALHFAEFGEYDYIDARIPNYSYIDLAMRPGRCGATSRCAPA
jgi:hypothetical protein